MAYVGFGANLGDAAATFAAAARALCAVPKVASVRAASSLWHSEPVGDADQPWFRNGCFAVSFAGEARALLGALLTIEAGLGRDRRLERKGGPRTCDLDLLLIDDQVIDEPELTVPHPRLHERAFVLAPLVELAGPDLWVPGHARAGELLSPRSGNPVTRGLPGD